MKVFCVGRNYVKHAEELNNDVPDKPLIFMKPATAVVKPGQDIYYPEFTNNLHYECELVVKIAKNGKHINPKFAFDYISEVSVGIDFTARDLQNELKQKGHSWEIAKAFDQSAPIGQFIPAKSIKNWDNIKFELFINGQKKQSGHTENLIFSIPKMISYISTFFTLQTGDIIFTGTPEGVGPVTINDSLTATLNGEKLLDLTIK